jgi:enoyl-CoA hydratase/carnithine racemase
MATIRRQIYGDLDRSRPEAVALSVELMLESFKGADLAEAMAAHQEKRPPRFGALRPLS